MLNLKEKNVKYGLKSIIVERGLEYISNQTLNLNKLFRKFKKHYVLIVIIAFSALLFVGLDLDFSIPEFYFSILTLMLVLTFLLEISEGHILAMNILIAQLPTYRAKEQMNDSFQFLSLNDKTVSNFIKKIKTTDAPELKLYLVLSDDTEKNIQFLSVYHAFDKEGECEPLTNSRLMFDGLNEEQKNLMISRSLSDDCHPLNSMPTIKELEHDVSVIAKVLSGMNFTVSLKDHVIYHKL